MSFPNGILSIAKLDIEFFDQIGVRLIEVAVPFESDFSLCHAIKKPRAATDDDLVGKMV